MVYNLSYKSYFIQWPYLAIGPRLYHISQYKKNNFNHHSSGILPLFRHTVTIWLFNIAMENHHFQER